MIITDRIGRHEVLLPINNEYYSFRGSYNGKDKKPGKISENSPIYYLSLCLKFGFLRHSCRCYGDYIEVRDCFISNAVFIVNGIFDCPITNYPITEAI